jgi:hypothetical protein
MSRLFQCCSRDFTQYGALFDSSGSKKIALVVKKELNGVWVRGIFVDFWPNTPHQLHTHTTFSIFFTTQAFTTKAFYYRSYQM